MNLQDVEHKYESFVEKRIILTYRSLSLLCFQVNRMLLIGSVNGYFSIVTIFLWEVGPLLGIRDL